MPAPLPNNCQDLLQQMVGFDTVVAYHSGRVDPEQQLRDYLSTLATAWGFTVRRLPVEGAGDNLLLEHRVAEDAPWLMFDSHMDTVGVEGMTIPPFAGELRDGRLYGRGACDTKGSGAAMLLALKAYAESTNKPNNVALLFSVGEEHIQIGARQFVSQHLPILDWRPAGVVVGEPTHMNVLAATGGFVRWKIATLGKPYHSSRPDQGHNAIYDMARVVTAIQTEYLPGIAAEHALIGRASAAITVVRGGKQVNVVPDHAELTFDRRLVPGEIADDEVAKVKALLARLAAEQPGMRVQHHSFESAPPLAPVDGGQLATTASEAIRTTGIECKISGELYTTNGNHFAAAGLPTIVAGPGDIAQAHTLDEWIALEELDRGVAGYLAIMQTAGAGPTTG